MWRETTKHERNMRIFREELDGFLPERILDFHVHILNAGVVPSGESYSAGGHKIHKYEFSDLEADLNDLYPGRETAAVCFGIPDIGYDRQDNNNYVAANCDGKRFFALRLLDPMTDKPDEVRSGVKDGGFLGLKPYLDYVRKENRNDVEIREMLPDWAMEIADSMGLIVVLHIPRLQRLADPLNQAQLVDLCRSYPNARIVLAHVGRAYYLKNVVGNLAKLKDIPNLWYDIAMVGNWEVLEYLFREVPADRVLYATDIPIGLAPGKTVEINDQYTYITPVPWDLSIPDLRGRVVYTSFIYEELRAVRKAVERLGLGKGFVEDLFWNNGMKLLGSHVQG